MALAGERPWRLFVAVPIPDALQSSLAEAVAALRAAPSASDWRWTDAAGWHVTLAFLGATDPARLASLTVALERAVAGAAPFEVSAGGLGAFPSARNARVLWYGIGDREGRLRALARSVSDAVEVADGGRFRAHITLARARERHGASATALVEADGAPDGLVPVREAVLYRSRIGRGPAQYEAIARAPLGAAASVAR